MNINITISQAVLSIIFGVIILIQPKFLSWIIGLWLILTGIIGLGILKF
jgi:uncharacterized membrane protein HdeD (DUF308 family)